MKERGRFIVFEGIDGSGKTTLSRMFYETLAAAGIDAAWFREPTDSRWGKKIRSLAQKKAALPPEKELSYFIADRRWDVREQIEPALAQGRVVVLDRYFYSTACYQGARGLDLEEILKKNREFAPEPDLVFLIDVEVKIALKRIEREGRSPAILFEKEAFLERVRALYLKLAARQSNFVLIDGALSPPEVLAAICGHYRKFTV